MGITDTQSYGLVIRDILHDALAPDPFFANYTVRKTRMLRVQTELLPYLGVYIADETMVPDGDSNAGNVRFIHTTRIGFSVMIANNDPVIAELQVDAAFWRIMNRLWTDEYITNVLSTYDPATGTETPDNTRFEGVERGQRRHVFGNAGLNNETPLAELQYDVTIKHRTTWSPIIPDDLEEIDITTGVKAGDTQAEMDQRQQVTRKYLFDITRKPIPKLKRKDSP